MNQASVRKLRRRFILIFMLSVLGVELLLIGLSNAAATGATLSDIRGALDYINENEGELPSHYGHGQGSDDDSGDESLNMDSLPFALSILRSFLFEDTDSDYMEELHLAVRYFSVFYDAEGSYSRCIINNVSVSEDEADTFAGLALTLRQSFGTRGYYFYLKSGTDDGGTIVTFLNCRSEITGLLRFFYASLIICFGILILIFWPVSVFSRALIQPELRNIARQKQFITNASHELKTPLAVIRANTEVEEMLNGENEWTRSTMRQVDSMTALIQNLVMISRADEQADKTHMSDIDLTAIVTDTASTFKPLALRDGLTLNTRISENVRMVAEEAAIRQLTSLLLDNAIKYCDKEGVIEVALSKKGRFVRLVVSNSYADGKNVDYSRFFDRFYRQDSSHAKTDKGGYGIGLSIAETLVGQYKGSIAASWRDGFISFTCQLQ